jgi:2-oxoisovalerate dehydrogenase E2 component (dihydrolipoyl transacylase)
MAHHVFRLPDIGEGTAEAELVAWHVAVGDMVEEDQPLADVMTDKATVEITSPVSGRITRLHGDVGQAIAIGGPLVEFDVGEGGGGEGERDAGSVSAPVAAAPAPMPEPRPPAGSADASRPKASPAVRRRAAEANVGLEDVAGTGPHGRIRQPDLNAYLAQRGTAPSPPAGEYQEIRLTGLRRRIAARMELSTRSIPHFSYIEEIDLTALEEARAALNAHAAAGRPRLTLLPFFIQAIVRLVPDFPRVNATYDGERGVLRQYRDVHVGIATQTAQGLMVPVVRDAGRRDLWDLAAEIARVAAAARDGSAPREMLTGSTITLTSLGRLGGIAATPIINPPEVAIIGPNRIVERPVLSHGAVVARKLMNLSASFDHRIVDGHDAARFVQGLKEYLESPALLVLAG